MPERNIVNQSSMFLPGGILDTNPECQPYIAFYSCDVACRSIIRLTHTHTPDGDKSDNAGNASLRNAAGS